MSARSDGGGVGLAPVMPPAAVLRRYVNMRIDAVYARDGGIVVEVCPVGHMSRRRVLLEGVTNISEITDDRQAWSDGDEAQAQQDIGDDMYEREREDRE